jgi:DNA mismatch endonuclease, patch repair protein
MKQKPRTVEARTGDKLSAQERSRLMARVRNRNTAPELQLRRLLHGAGYRFRLHPADLSGTPDIVLPKYRAALFVHGCFWHGHECPKGARPGSNVAFWNAKVARNRQRDQDVEDALEREGWAVHTVWECELRSPGPLLARIQSFLEDQG